MTAALLWLASGLLLRAEVLVEQGGGELANLMTALLVLLTFLFLCGAAVFVRRVMGRRKAQHDEHTQALLESVMGRAQILLWTAIVTRKEGKLIWRFSLLPESRNHPLLRIATNMRTGGLWHPDHMPDFAQTNARSTKAIETGASGYEQEFRVLEGDKTHYLSEQVAIRRIAENEWQLLGVDTDITARRSAEDQSRRSTNLLRNIIERADCMPWQASVRDMGSYFDWNFDVPTSGMQRRIFGGDGGYKTKWFYRGFTVMQRESIDQRCSEALRSGQSGYEQEFKIVRQSDNQVFWIHERTMILSEGPGQWQLYGIMIDVTARHFAEEAHLMSEAHLRQILRHVDCMLWHAEVRRQGDGSLTWIFSIPPSRLYYSIFGCNPADRGQHVWDEEHVPEMAAMTHRAEQALFTGLTAYEQEFTYVDHSQRRSLHEQVTIRRVGEAVWHLMGLVMDITARREAELGLAAEKERLAVTLRAMDEAVVTVNNAGEIQYLNRAAELLLGKPEKELYGRRLVDVLTLVEGTRSQAWQLDLKSVLAEACTVYLPAQCALLHSVSERVELEGCCVPLFEQEALVVGAVLVARDVTVRNRLELQLQRVSKLESVGILAGGIAHDFNNILTAVMGNLGLALLESNGATPLEGCLREAQNAALRARDLTQQLLTFAKGGEPIRTAVNLVDVVREVALFALRGTKVACHFEMPEDLWHVNADRGQIGQIVQNLVLNSLQAMPEGGNLRISAHDEVVEQVEGCPLAAGDYVLLSVADNGPGIPPEALPRIFDPYFTTKADGSGLGLATVHSIVQKHRGSIDVRSSLGRGTEFVIRLPALRDVAAEPEPVVAPVSEQLEGRVLVMDDEASIRRLIDRILRRAGLEVVVTNDGRSVVEAYQASWRAGAPFDLVIMDLTVPGGMGGRQAMEIIHGINPAVRSIVASGYSNDPVIANFQSYGFTAMVAKPFDAAHFLSVVAAELKAE